MFLQWAVFRLLLLTLVSTAGAMRSRGFGRKVSTMLSFDLRRKTKHHRERNVTILSTTPAPTTNKEDEEEIEFSLRVCVKGTRARSLQTKFTPETYGYQRYRRKPHMLL